MNIVIKLGCQLVLLPFLLIFFAPFFLPYTSFDSKLRPSLPPPRPTPTPSPSPPPPPPRPIPSPPRLAYVISGGSGDGAAVLRLLQSLYHPHNYYAVCLDDDADRVNVRLYAAMHPVLSYARNVRVVSASTGPGGPAAISSILHAAAVLLAEFGEWDWLVNVGPGHYPLVTQDDLLCMLWHMPRELNFIDHAMDLRYKNETPMVVDRGLYMEETGDVLQITEKRSLPTAFDLYTGSAWMILSRTFVEYCIWGWDNLPRRALMYYANSMNSTESYFQTVICNAPQFQNTIVNHSLHFISPDDSQHQHPHHIMGSKGLGAMINSGAPFAANLKKDDPVLDLIDSELLFRGLDMLVPGGWCAGWRGKGTHECLAIDDVSRILPGLGARRVEMLFAILLDVEYRKRRCNQGFASRTS